VTVRRWIVDRLWGLAFALAVDLFLSQYILAWSVGHRAIVYVLSFVLGQFVTAAALAAIRLRRETGSTRMQIAKASPALAFSVAGTGAVVVALARLVDWGLLGWGALAVVVGFILFLVDPAR
jgi:hypothetical protein